MNTVTLVIFLTSSLGFEIFSSAANPVFSLEDLPLYTLPLEFSKNPVDSLRSMRQSSSTSHLRGENSSFSSFYSLHWFYCCSTAATAGLDRVCLAAGSGVWIGSIKTFNKIILKGNKTKQNSSCSGLLINFCSQAAPLGPDSPAFKVMHT